jgi:hypothetical protein
MKTYQSRWGYHPCDYATYGKLKAIHRAFWEGRRLLAAQGRYLAKQPHNRVLRAGGVVLGPRPEPVVPDVVREICASRYDIPREYHNARHGRPQDEVKPLGIPAAVIERWASQLASAVAAT